MSRLGVHTRESCRHRASSISIRCPAPTTSPTNKRSIYPLPPSTVISTTTGTTPFHFQPPSHTCDHPFHQLTTPPVPVRRAHTVHQHRNNDHTVSHQRYTNKQHKQGHTLSHQLATGQETAPCHPKQQDNARYTTAAPHMQSLCPSGTSIYHKFLSLYEAMPAPGKILQGPTRSHNDLLQGGSKTPPPAGVSTSQPPHGTATARYPASTVHARNGATVHAPQPTVPWYHYHHNRGPSTRTHSPPGQRLPPTPFQTGRTLGRTSPRAE